MAWSTTGTEVQIGENHSWEFDEVQGKRFSGGVATGDTIIFYRRRQRIEKTYEQRGMIKANAITLCAGKLDATPDNESAQTVQASVQRDGESGSYKVVWTTTSTLTAWETYRWKIIANEDPEAE